MQNLYSVLEDGKIGIFESPTGTGKSLSIICGAVKWLKDFQEKQKIELLKIIQEKSEEDADDWFNSFLEKQKKTHQLQDAKEELKHVNAYEERIKAIRSAKTSKTLLAKKSVIQHSKKKKLSHDGDFDDDVNEDDFVVGDNGEDNDDVEDDAKKEKRHVLKIYYASRTHSQLAQFLGEIQKSPFRDAVTVTTLGSRATFCVNDSVSKLKNLNLINDSCMDLQRKKGSGKKCCPFYKNFDDMQDNILSAVHDIEEIVHLGRELHSCPYYGTRKVIPDVEIVLLPYNVLLHKPTREAYGIVIKDNVLIIDEAHNLVEAVNSMYSAEISGTVLEQTFLQVNCYLSIYKTRFSQENLRNLKLFVHVLKCLIDFFKKYKSNTDSPKMMPVSEFIIQSGISNVNIFELVKYAENSLIGQKIHGFTAARVAKGLTPQEDQNKKPAAQKISGTASFLNQIKERNSNVPKPTPVPDKRVTDLQYKPSAIFNFIEFMKTLTFPTEDGRILVRPETAKEKSLLKFLHLNPATHFQDIVKEARSVILAGGTMQPVSEFTHQLFIPAGVSLDRMSLFSCGHVIPPDNLSALGMATGPCGGTLDFTYKSRQLPQTIKEIGSVLLNIGNVIRGGVVCFFPSYDYEEFVYNELSKSKMLQSIAKKYKVFREPKASSDVDRVLSDYAKCVSMSCSGNSTLSGALLFSIVGGKMSEGINFSDDLGRCVVMVGLPYPNKFSVELQEKMAYLNQNNASVKGKSAGDIYYNNLCMKAVNQSIGRAIRHKNDYASIILLDHRYNNASVKELLPSWISKSLTFHQKFGTAYVALRKFFMSKTKN
ncbi:hypothetical protein JTE90_028022 [Oedothorax gibbosus]|uniref:Helicase ATP-binding domain-containing protein n=1 Tax=Oedothorax gibbosus TaxID=931172 RepID=A0AAV6VF74_9ARAC|nr:hypothetical protein JTE90_028022 [Oedothorax gibbosus]